MTAAAGFSFSSDGAPAWWRASAAASQSARRVWERKNIDQPFPDGDGEERRDRAASYPAGVPANVRVRNRASPSPTMATGRTCRALPAFEALPACPELGEAA